MDSNNWHNNNMNEKISMHLKRQQKFHGHQFFRIPRYKLLEHPSKESKLPQPQTWVRPTTLNLSFITILFVRDMM